MSAIRVFLFVLLISAVAAFVGKYILIFVLKLFFKESKFFKWVMVKSNIENDVEDAQIEAEVEAEMRKKQAKK